MMPGPGRLRGKSALAKPGKQAYNGYKNGEPGHGLRGSLASTRDLIWIMPT